MADYNKLKVAELKEELKRRNIPLTGLKLKQQFVDKLIAADAGTDAVSKDVPDKEMIAPEPPLDPSTEAPAEGVRDGQDQPSVLQESASGRKASPKDVESPPSKPIQAQDSLSNPTAFENSNTEPSAEQLPPLAIPQSVEQSAEAPASAQTPLPKSPRRPDFAMSDTVSPSKEPEMVEDSRKRKRRSITPPPNSAEVAQKRARASNGSPIITKSSTPEVEGRETIPTKHQIQETGFAAGSSAHSAPIENSALPKKNQESAAEGEEPIKSSEEAVIVARDNAEHKPAMNSIRKSSGPDARFKDLVRDGVDRASPPSKELVEDDDRVIEPAVHPATASLYIRNLKRPIKLPELKSHLRALASPPKSSPDPEILKSLYLDGIKTHAFAVFSNVSAASRVRSELHDTRWPEERTREPLWVDFVPDEKVGQWIKIEEDGGDGRMVRWEVIYDEGDGGIQATLQKAGASRKLSMPVQRSAEPVPPDPHPDRTGMIHPDRAGLVPHNEPVRSSRELPLPTGGSGGSGFRALDDLFPSTTAKPKLYFKPVSQDLIATRKGRFRDLLPVAEMRGRGADQEMRRYSFEDGGFWVDKGPEFGYGSRGGGGGGAGAGVAGGGYRRGRGGRGGPFRGRAGFHEDSWRGRGR